MPTGLMPTKPTIVKYYFLLVNFLVLLHYASPTSSTFQECGGTDAWSLQQLCFNQSVFDHFVGLAFKRVIFLVLKKSKNYLSVFDHFVGLAFKRLIFLVL